MNSAPELRASCLRLLTLADPVGKAAEVLALDVRAGRLDPDTVFTTLEHAEQPGRSEKPPLLPHTQIKFGALNTARGHAALVHSIVHIERNAIDLALDICWRFPGLPEAFYRDWLQVAREEANHFTLLRAHLRTLGFDYGDFPAHNGLWEMAERTRDDLLARVALVPRTLEARGLDASPAVKAKLLSIGDLRGGDILDLILREEIGHVATGNRWYAWACAQRGLDPLAAYAALTKHYQAPRLKKPFNLEARRAAGFTEVELERLQAAE